MKLYELAFLFPTSIPQEKLREFSQKIVTLIESKGGTVEFQASPSRKILAYPIKRGGNKYSSCYFATLNFSLPRDRVSELTEDLKKEDHIVRFLISARLRPTAPPSIALSHKKRPPVSLRKQKLPKVELEKLEEKLEELLKE